MSPEDSLPRLGVSLCLLGESVRHDGGHRRNSFVVDLLGPHFEWVPVCPEVESGMGVPRESVHLEKIDSGIRMIANFSGTDHTDSMTKFSAGRSAELGEAQLRGYIFKSGSPSCGLENVPLTDGDVEGATAGGLFSEAVVIQIPDLPTVEEQALADPATRQGFVERVFTYKRLSEFFGKERSVGQVAMFHAMTRLQVEAHSPGAHSEIVKMFSAGLGFEELRKQYMGSLMEAIKEPLTIKQHFDTMREIAGEIRPHVETPVFKEVGSALQEYRKGNLPLSSPLTLLRHYVRLHEVPKVNGQTYLEPEPGELILRPQV